MSRPVVLSGTYTRPPSTCGAPRSSAPAPGRVTDVGTAVEVSTMIIVSVPGTTTGTTGPSVLAGASTEPEVTGRFTAPRPPDRLTTVIVPRVGSVTTGAPPAIVRVSASPGAPTLTGVPAWPAVTGSTWPLSRTGTHSVPW